MTGTPEATPTPAPAPGASPADQGSSVMISMPKEALMALQQIVQQLYAGVEEIVKQAGSQQGPPDMNKPAAPAAPAEGAPAAGGSEEDEAFLKDMANQGSQK